MNGDLRHEGGDEQKGLHDGLRAVRQGQARIELAPQNTCSASRPKARPCPGIGLSQSAVTGLTNCYQGRSQDLQIAIRGGYRTYKLLSRVGTGFIELSIKRDLFTNSVVIGC